MTKQKFFYGFLIILIPTIIVISGCTQEKIPIKSEQIATQPTSEKLEPELVKINFLTYESLTFRINYPSDWKKQERAMETIVAFFSPKESSSDIFQENLNVIVQDLSTKPMTLSEYTDTSLKEIKQFVTNSKILDSSSITLDDNPAHKVVYTGKHDQFNLKWMQLWTVKNNKVYVLTYTAEPDKYNDFLGTVQEMIDSFKII